MALRAFSTCRYSAFLSYAYDDDAAWNDWIKNFSYELNLGLSSRVPGVRIRTFLSSENGPVLGPLSPALHQAVADSFVAILFVHDGYLQSEWCLEELRHFKQLAGDQGFQERLYLVAMSESAMNQLKAKAAWRELVPYGDLIWMPFYQADDNPDWPIDIYASNARQRKTVVSNEFWHRFLKLREHLVQQIRRSQKQEERPREYPELALARAEPPAERGLVKMYIEGKVEQERFWESLGQQIAGVWGQVMALEQVEPPMLLRPTGLPITEIDERPVLADADGVVLLWGKKTPESLVAQISRVEPKLSGPHFAPGLVAYLLSDSQEQPPSAIHSWPVVRFAVRDGVVIVLADDVPKLAAFLRNVLSRKQRRGA